MSTYETVSAGSVDQGDSGLAILRRYADGEMNEGSMDGESY